MTRPRFPATRQVRAGAPGKSKLHFAEGARDAGEGNAGKQATKQDRSVFNPTTTFTQPLTRSSLSSSSSPQYPHIPSIMPAPSSSTGSGSSSSSDAASSVEARLNQLRSHLTHKPRSSRLAGQVCIVTGVGSLTGIGRASVLLFAHEGARAIYALDHDDSNLPSLKESVKEGYGDQTRVETLACDCADEDEIRKLVERVVQEEGRLDVFFANAGVPGQVGPLGTLEAEDLAETMRVNVAR